MRAPLLTLAAVLLLAGCAPSAPPSTATPGVVATPPSPPPPPEQQLHEVGQAASNGGITLVVKAARRSDSIQMNESNFRPGSGYEKYTDTRAGDGAKFVVVDTHVVNNAKTSLDLTCSLPVATALIDDRDRNFDPIDDLYKLKGNPECNDQLQPGFEADMTWVYRVPVSARIVGWGFQDFTDVSAPPAGWTVVRLPLE